MLLVYLLLLLFSVRHVQDEESGTSSRGQAIAVNREKTGAGGEIHEEEAYIQQEGKSGFGSLD